MSAFLKLSSFEVRDYSAVPRFSWALAFLDHMNVSILLPIDKRERKVNVGHSQSLVGGRTISRMTKRHVDLHDASKCAAELNEVRLDYSRSHLRRLAAVFAANQSCKTFISECYFLCT